MNFLNVFMRGRKLGPVTDSIYGKNANAHTHTDPKTGKQVTVIGPKGPNKGSGKHILH